MKNFLVSQQHTDHIKTKYKRHGGGRHGGYMFATTLKKENFSAMQEYMSILDGRKLKIENYTFLTEDGQSLHG